MPIPSPLIGWTVWGCLERHKQIELILLKGHLILEIVLGDCIARLSGEPGIDVSNHSFHRKTELLAQLLQRSNSESQALLALVRRLNTLRNRLAHEFQFEDGEESLRNWSNSVLVTLPYVKLSKFTSRTRLVHAFASVGSALSKLVENPVVSIGIPVNSIPPQADHQASSELSRRISKC